MLDLLIDGFACHRITRLIVEDTVFDRPRHRVKQALHEAGWPAGIDLLGCPWCVGVWVGFGVAVARWRFPRAWPAVARALAIADVAGVISSVT
jgi:hypothetical protein